eukprot:g2662.t1
MRSSSSNPSGTTAGRRWTPRSQSPPANCEERGLRRPAAGVSAAALLLCLACCAPGSSTAQPEDVKHWLSTDPKCESDEPFWKELRHVLTLPDDYVSEQVYGEGLKYATEQKPLSLSPLSMSIPFLNFGESPRTDSKRAPNQDSKHLDRMDASSQ